MKRKILALMLTGVMVMLIPLMSACSSGSTASVSAEMSKLDSAAWQYNESDDVYYQIGLAYCESPADSSYENLAVFVPGAYMEATQNDDGTYTCTLSESADVEGYTAATAPIVMPINTPGYSAQDALTEYTSVSDYTSAGFVYVHAGCRGRDAGAPAGVTDLKAAVRYLRYCDGRGDDEEDVLPGNTDSIFTFGHSGGGAQSAIMGATGDSKLYDTYLEEIGAVEGVSDSILGAMCWCPITNLDTADEAYEWMMGSTRSGLSDEEQSVSDKLAEAYAEYVNSAGIKDVSGSALELEESDDGIYQAGSYYDYMKAAIEESLNNFLEDTEFPYDASSSSSGDGMMSGGGPGGDGGSGGAPSGEAPSGEAPSGDDSSDIDSADGASSGEAADAAPSGDDSSGSSDTAASGSDSSNDMNNAEANDNITRNSTTSSLSLDGSYDTAEDYVDALNANGDWVTYDADSNTVTISSIADFVSAFKSASKNLGAFDQFDAGQGENTLFGYGDGNGAHFDATLAEILTDLGSEYADAYNEDLEKEDSAGNKVAARINMYTPLYYLLESQDGYKTSSVASYWRIRTGINQGDCALSTEMNLALALQNYQDVKGVDFATVWGQGHTMAERTGDSTSNFISWINECMGRV